MAISDDTAALVAAQLTVAWATRSGVRQPNPSLQHDAEVVLMYQRFLRSVQEVPLKS